VALLNPIRIRLRYADLDTFVEKFAPNVTRGGVFLASRNIQPVGAVFPFEIQLMGGDIVLAGEGRVTWVKEFNPAEPQRPYGMGVQFVSVALETKPILARILRAKDAAGPRRTTTGPLTPLGAAAGGGHPGERTGTANGKPTKTPIDTSVDLVAEYGLDDQTVRRLMERTWMMGVRTSDDLADLLEAQPPEEVTLAQALAELPRLLDAQFSRRRASGGFRAVAPAAAAAAAAAPAPAAAAPETTTIEGGGPSAEGGDDTKIAEATTLPTTATRAAVGTDASTAGDEDDDAAGSVSARVHAALGDTTDMTGG
jgi:uncharacterized protein (TIGR02266 family)